MIFQRLFPDEEYTVDNMEYRFSIKFNDDEVHFIDTGNNLESHESKNQQNKILDMGISIGLHTAVLMIILLLKTYSDSYIPADIPVVTVHLVEMTADSTCVSTPSLGTENEKTAQPAAGGDNIDTIHPIMSGMSATQPQMAQKPIINRPHQRHADTAGKKNKLDKGTPPPSLTAKTDSSSLQNMESSSSQHADSTGEAKSNEGGQTVQSNSESEGGPGKGYRNVWGNRSGIGGTSTGKGSTDGEFNLKQVDQPPVPIQKINPEFPTVARKLGTAGSVVVKFLVKTDGSVIRASILEANPEGLFDQSALDAIQKWRFTPGIYQGNAVATWVILPVHFRLTR